MENREKYNCLEPMANGAELLTKYFGDESWKGKIDPDKLVMSSLCNCVLGQIFGDYWAGIKELGLDNEVTDRSVPFGFDISINNPDERHYWDLAEAWRGYLKKGKGE